MALESELEGGALVKTEASSQAGWHFARSMGVDEASLSEVHASIAVPQQGSWFRRLLAFSGPGYMVSVGYMDPGQLGDRHRRRLAVRLHAAVASSCSRT